MGTARVKEEEEANIGIMAKEEEEADKNNSTRGVNNLKERKVGKKQKSPKQGLTSAEVLNIMFFGGAAPSTIDYPKLT